MAKPPFDAKREYKLRLAIAWLLVELNDFQPHDAKAVLERGVKAGHKQRTLQRASTSLGVHKRPHYGDDGKIDGWTWTQRGVNLRSKKDRRAFTVAP